MYHHKKISVVTFTKNCAKLLPTAIKSFAYQDYPNMEWLIVDDSSTDNTLEIAESYAAKDSRLRIIKNTKPRKPAELYNQALTLANGAYLAFLDAEDVWVKNKIWKQLAFALRYTAPICHTSYAFIDSNCNVLPVGCRRVQPFLNLVNYHDKSRICLSTCMLDMEKIRHYLPISLKENHNDPFIFFMRKGLISQGMGDVLTLCRLRFGPPTPPEHYRRLEQFSNQILNENKNIPTMIRYDSFRAENIAQFELEPSAFIGHDVYLSMDELKNLKI